MEKKTVYVQTQYSMPVMVDGRFNFLEYMKANGNFSPMGFINTPILELHRHTDKDDDFVYITGQLTPKENVYVFTEEELLELKKMWADDAFENGYSRCCWEETNHPKSHSVIDKEYYINNLTI